MTTMADCLPRICEAMCDNEQYGRSDGPFRLNATGSYRIARLYMDKHVALKFQELRYLQNKFHVVQNQLNSYITALPDVMIYVISALNFDTYVEDAKIFRRRCNVVFHQGFYRAKIDYFC